MSASSFGRRKPKRVGLSNDMEDDEGDEEVSFVKRPAPKNKRGSSAKVSFGNDDSMGDEDSPTVVLKPKKASLGRQALEKNALRRSGLPTFSNEEDSLPRNDDTRPSYSKEYLAELKSSTPSTPQTEQAERPLGGELELASQSASSLARYEGISSNAIPTDVEIQEKKARRARLAKEQKYGHGSDSDDGNSLLDAHDSDDDEFRTQRDKIALRESKDAKPSKYEETRLVRDDEDFMEDFDDYVETGQISLSRKAEKRQKAKERAQLRELIENAEGGSESDDSSDSEADARREYEAAQTKRGMEGRTKDKPRYEEPKTPPRITPLPTLDGCKEKLRASLQGFESELAMKMKQLEQVEQERKEIDEREKDIQNLLNETADRFRQLVASGVLKNEHVDSRLLTNGANGNGDSVPSQEISMQD